MYPYILLLNVYKGCSWAFLQATGLFYIQPNSVNTFCIFGNCEASHCTSEYEGLRVLHAIPNGYESWVLRYIAITNDYPIGDIEEKISKKVGVRINMERLNYDFDVCVKLLLAV